MVILALGDTILLNFPRLEANRRLDTAGTTQPPHPNLGVLKIC